MAAPIFSGSYRAGEVAFLLKPLALKPLADVLEKERLIQSGERHYSEIIGLEAQPSAEYLALFKAAVAANAAAMARDLFSLAQQIRQFRPGPITLVSLARAGTPIGVLLRHLLARYYGLQAAHYSVSIIRDRGIDANALDFILQSHAPQALVFVDGWTGKGSIANELARSLALYRQARGIDLPAELFVLCDLAGLAHAAGSNADYLIPSAILNATVSGLVSRSILNDEVGPGDFHGCLYYSELAAADQSRWFIDAMLAALETHAAAMPAGLRTATQNTTEHAAQQAAQQAAVRAASEQLVQQVMQRFGVTDRNYIKPGIGEATRSLLRRVPRLLLVQDANLPELAHLMLLARERGVTVEVDTGLPVKAVAIIRKLADA